MSQIKIDENIKKLNDQIINTREELLRMEGSLRMLLQLKELGVSEIPINIMNTTEVVDGRNQPKSEDAGGDAGGSKN